MRVNDTCRFTGISRSTHYLFIASGDIEIISRVWYEPNQVRSIVGSERKSRHSLGDRGMHRSE